MKEVQVLRQIREKSFEVDLIALFRLEFRHLVVDR